MRNPLLQPPPGIADPHYAGPESGPPDLFGDVASNDDNQTEERESLPPYMQSLFDVAGVPAGLRNGDDLVWINAANVSTRFSRARVRVDGAGAWIDFGLTWETGRVQRLRVTRYLDLVALEDTSAFSDSEPLSIAAGRLLADFRAATFELFITH